MLVSAIPAFNDNYIWAIQARVGSAAVIVDPGDAEPVLAWLAEQQVALAAILITHHHWDHTDGIAALLEAYPRQPIPVFGPDPAMAAPLTTPIACITDPLHDGELFRLPELDNQWQVFATPGHTLDHLCFYTPGYLFCGDTLFSAGCGRMFEGTAEQFQQSLQSLAELPASTNVYCAHEYTEANLRFARAAEPENQAVLMHQRWVKQQRQQGLSSLPSQLGKELEINPFLRAQSAAEFARLRRWKDNF
ncbi:hydroxyacylglutathione hydrolase [Pseudidiomarina sp. PP-1MA]|uniref:Hydroxyacylglutathione hydrolase n=1 Tax=Pseudidiomarina sp. PP-1MA TaxID=3237706 RepID=A0AB39X7T5_9GAMM